VVRELWHLLPAEHILYYADSAYCPYGARSSEEIRERSALISRALVERGAKALVVACNTASSVAISDLRRLFIGVPVVGLEPAVKPAAALTKTGKVGILATTRTVAGERLAQLIIRHAEGVEVLTMPAPGIVELVEAGHTSGPRVEAALRPFLDPLLARGIDTLVLGCTHYPFLRETIQGLVGPSVVLLDSGVAIARRTAQVLTDTSPPPPNGSRHFTLLTSGDPKVVSRAATALLKHPIQATLLEIE